MAPSATNETLLLTFEKRKSRGGGGGGSTGGPRGGANNPTSVTVAGTFGRGSTASSANRGGGRPIVIPAGSPFAGRTYGGATRGAIYGTAAFGAGYLGVLALSNVAGRNFGFGFWPLYIGPRYYGDDEYGPKDNSSRPGGPQIASSFNPPSLTATSPPQYIVYGDNSSVAFIAESLVWNCSAVIVGNETTTTNQTLLPSPAPQYDLQYYRESSFVLGNFFEGYTSPSPPLNDSAANNVTAPFLYPSTDRNLTFQDCVNYTIAANLPISNSAHSSKVRSSININGMEMQGIPLAGMLVGQHLGRKWFGLEVGMILGLAGMVCLSV
ncbi:hypothetical protein BT69DRAFT_1352821 [Atractiella rhizophila]|nr:hypothetical protein BT69DRAFT_1352821 [Atractiella rhizophila]